MPKIIKLSINNKLITPMENIYLEADLSYRPHVELTFDSPLFLVDVLGSMPLIDTIYAEVQVDNTLFICPIHTVGKLQVSYGSRYDKEMKGDLGDPFAGWYRWEFQASSQMDRYNKNGNTDPDVLLEIQKIPEQLICKT